MDKRLTQHTLGFWEIAKKPTPQELQQYYAEKYYQEGKGSYELKYSDEELRFFQAKLEQRSAVLQRHLSALNPKQRRKLLDVGCGEGYALAYFRSQGWEVKGLDFSSAGVESKNASCLDALVVGDVFALLQAEIASGNAYDAIWLQNVLEHVIDPLALLEALRSMVSPGGLAVITVPNDCSITQQAALAHHHIESDFWVAPPDHLTYFDHRSLTKAANQKGWECVEMLSDFPVDWFLFNPGSNYVSDKSKGKAAHMAKVQIENYIHAQPIDNVLRFWSAAAALGIGRNITAFLRPIGNE